MSILPRRLRRLVTLLVCAVALWCAGTLSWLLRAQAGEPPGGILELATSTGVRTFGLAQMQGLLPSRGTFTFPAPYSTQGVRLTNATDCSDWFDCVNSLTGSPWRNISNSAGSNVLYVVLGLDRTNGGVGPSLFRYNKTTGETVNLGPLFAPGDDRSWSGLDGWYFSATAPTMLYVNLDRQLERVDVLTHTTSVVFDITAQFGDDKEVYHALSSRDDRVHSFVLRLVDNYLPIGCGIYREDTSQFSYFPGVGKLRECQVDASGEWLLVNEDRDADGGVDNRIIYLPTGSETVLFQEAGVGSEADLGFGMMVGADTTNALPGAIRLRSFGPVAPGPVVYHSLAGRPPSLTQLSFSHARPAPLDQQYACGGAVNRTNGPRANEIVCAQLDGSLRTLVIAPTMTDLDALGGGPNDDLIKQPFGNLDPTGQYFLWTNNLGTDRLDAFLVRVLSQVLVQPPSDGTAPTVSLIAPAAAATLNGPATLTATASDNIGVAGVRFRLDGLDFGPEVTSAPFTRSWDTTTAPDGVHALTAVARDAAGNFAISTPVLVTINNTAAGLQIANVSASGVIERLALVTWTTNQLADTLVEYGVTSAYGSSTGVGPALVASHVRTLSGLTPGTTYHYRVTSKNAQAATVTSGDFTFTTAAAAKISNVAVPALAGTSATVTWSTDIPATSQVEYGPTTAYGDATNMAGELTAAHIQGLYDLQPGTTYHFRIYAITAGNVLSVSGDFTFTTPLPDGAELPRVMIDSTAVPGTGSVIPVNAGQDLQAAIDAAAPGDTLVLQAGATFAGHFVLRNKPGEQWITLTSSALASLPAAGTRVSPAMSGLMPKIVSPNALSAIATDAGAHHYRFTGIEITTTWSVTTETNFNVVTLQAPAGSSLADVPSHITFDRCYVHGTPTGNVRRGIAMNSTFTAVVDSYFEDFHEIGADSQAIAGWAGLGPYKIVNNFLAAAGENILFGGGIPAFANTIPADIEIRGNHFFKPLSWTGSAWSVKNLLEFKNAQRVLVEGNVFENVWAASQNGLAVLLTPRSEGGAVPGAVRDIIIRRNRFINVAQGIDVSGEDDSGVSLRTQRVQIRDNVINVVGLGSSGNLLLVTNGPTDLVVDHNTGFTTGQMSFSDNDPKSHGFVFTNNIMQAGLFGFLGAGTGAGIQTLDAFYVLPTFAKNAVVGSPYGTYPADNFFPNTLDDVGFAGYLTGNYHLLATSPYKNAGTDGADLGANIDAVALATNCAVSGACSTSDGLPPLVALLSPESGSTVTGNRTITAVASDNVSVAGVQFQIDGTNLGAEVTAGAFTMLWNTSASQDGLHTLTAVARDAAGHVAVSPPVSVTVLNTPPVISGVTASGLTGSTATIGWLTDELATTRIEFGTTTAYGSPALVDSSLVLSHTGDLQGLALGTTYHYRVISANAAGLTTASADATFTTVAPPVISAVVVSNVTQTSATIGWTTDQSTSSQVEYGPTTAYGSTTVFDAARVTTHSQTLAPLATATTYHYRVSSMNSVGLMTTSGDSTFISATPPVISAVTASAITGVSATIVWSTDQPANSRVEFGLTSAYGSSTLDATMLLSHSQSLTGLTPGTTYHYRVVSANIAGMSTASGDFTLTTVAFPVIGGVGTSAVSGTTATISWSTDQPANSSVEYGPTTAYGTTTFDPGLLMTHGQGLTGLALGTTYHFRVKSANSVGVLSTSGDFTFTTLAAPVISGVAASGVTGSSATIAWTTDQASSSLVEYGPTTDYGTTAIDGTLVTSHSRGLAGLALGTAYHYRVKSVNTAGLQTTSGDFTFTTVAAPALSGIGASAITGSSATIAWTTDQAASSQIDYGLTSSYGATTTLDAALVTAHSQGLSALAAGTTYHYRVRSTNSAGLLVTSSDFTFATIAPPVISGAGATTITGTSATIAWTTDQPADSQVEYGLTQAYGNSTTLNAALVTSHGQGLTGLAVGTTYHYRIRSKNSVGLLTTSADLVFATTAAPLVSAVSVSAITGTAFTVGWTTDQPADSQIEYGVTTAYGSTTALNASLVTTHSQSVTGLSPGTVYHFRVKSANSTGLLAIVGDFTATTPAVFVQGATNSNDGAGSSIAQALPAGVTAGNLIVAAVSWGNSATLSCSDSHSNVYTVIPIQYDSTNNQSFGICYAPNILAGATTVTATFSSNPEYRRLLVHEYGGIATTSPVDVTVKNIANGTTAANNITTTAATTTSPGDLIFAAVMDDSASTTIQAGTGYTARTTVSDALSEDRILATPGSVSATWTFAAAHRYLAQLVAFKPKSTSTPPVAPAISGVASSGVTGTAATIGWTTDQPADSQVDFGLTSTYGTTTTLNAALVTTHTQGLTGLTAGTTYHYRVRSTNVSALSAQSGDFTFTTLAAPVISGITASGLTGSTATIGWTTDQAADSQVDYGPTTTYGTSTPVNPSLVTTHALDLSGLASGTTYHYRVRSKNSVGGVTTSVDAVFVTVAAPVISAVGSSAITSATATIGWTTDQAADSQVEYGTSTAYGQTTTLNSTPVTAHAQGLTGLAPGTTYHYRVRSMNSVGLLSTSADFVFVTAFTPPSISGVTASAITGTAATIGWITDQATDSQVEYGLTTSYGSNSSLDAALVTTHSQVLTGLSIGTTYHYRVKSKNAAGLLAVSADATFATAVAPVISSVAASALTGTTATIGWTTNQGADSQVEYGLTTLYGLTTSLDGTLTNVHSQGLSGLAIGTTYHYRVKSRNSVGLLTVSADFTLTSVTAPVISAVGVSGITGTAATIGWTTDQTADSQVEYGLTTAYGSTTALNATLVTTHAQIVTDLANGTTYHYRVRSTNGVGLLTMSGDSTFTTVAAPLVSGVSASAVTGTNATIGWTTDQASDSQVDYGLTTAYGSTTGLNGALVTTHSQTLTGLANGTTYHYRVRSTNSVGVQATSGDFTVTTIAAPIVSAVTSSAITGYTATVSWSTDQSADSQVEYGLTTDYGNATTLDASLITAHSLNLAGLAPGTTYHFRVKSRNGVGLLTTSADFTFTTIPAPVIMAVSSVAITGTGAGITWTTDQLSDSQVELGLTTSYGTTTSINPALVTSHAHGLAGLANGTTYHYRVKSRNTAGVLAVSGDFTFTTVAAPAISNVTASAITGTSATIGWTTDQNSDSQVEYGPTLAYGSTTSLDGTLTAVHGQGLASLAFGTTYHYRVKSKNSIGLLATSADFTFTTIAAPPIVSGLVASALTGTSATIGWTTDLASTSQVEYGLTSSYGSATALDATLVVTHSQDLTGLAIGTTYHYRVKSANSDGVLTTSADAVFTTIAPAVIGGVGTSAVTATSATISWSTDQPGTSQVEYGTTTAYGSVTSLDASLVTAHLQGLTGLTPSTVYHYRVKTTNSVGLTATSADFTFPTALPPALSGIGTSAVTGTTATVSWTTDQAATSQVEYGVTTSYGSATTLDSALVTSHSQGLAGLTPATTYHYRVISANTFGLTTTSADFIVTTVAPPTISAVAASGLTTTSATIGWTTNQTATSQVEYGLTTAYGSTTSLDATGVLTHSQGIAGLTVGTTYHYRVKSTNSVGLLSVSGDFTFSTIAITLLQSAGGTNDGSSTTIAQAFGATTVAGNLIVAAVSWGTNGTLSCSDSQGNVYTVLPVQYDSSNNQSLGICYAPNIKGGAVTVTAAFSVNSSFRRILVHEYSGIKTSAPVDVTAANIANGTTAANNITTTAVTTTTPGSLVFAAVMDDTASTTITAGTNFTLRASVNGSDLVSEDRILNTAGSVTGTWTFTAAHRYLARIVVFKGAGQ